MTSRPPSATTSQPQPEPNCPVAAALTFSWRASTLPKVDSIAAARAPVGAAAGEPLMIDQNSEWLACPPPWLRTAPRIASGSFRTA